MNLLNIHTFELYKTSWTKRHHKGVTVFGIITEDTVFPNHSLYFYLLEKRNRTVSKESCQVIVLFRTRQSLKDDPNVDVEFNLISSNRSTDYIIIHFLRLIVLVLLHHERMVRLRVGSID